MDDSDSLHFDAVDPDRLARIVAIVGRYPDTSSAENDEVIKYLQSGPIRDRNSLLNIAIIHDQLYAFQEDHSHRLGVSLGAYLIVAVMFLAAIGTIAWLLWDVGVPQAVSGLKPGLDSGAMTQIYACYRPNMLSA